MDRPGHLLVSRRWSTGQPVSEVASPGAPETAGPRNPTRAWQTISHVALLYKQHLIHLHPKIVTWATRDIYKHRGALGLGARKVCLTQLYRSKES